VEEKFGKIASRAIFLLSLVTWPNDWKEESAARSKQSRM